jgi:SAM-dependent methyltransferase
LTGTGPSGYVTAVPGVDPLEGSSLSRLYRERFAAEDRAFKEHAWAILCERMFQPYVRETDTVLDLGAGHGEFLNSIRAGKKIAVDLNPDVAQFVRDARFLQIPSTDLSPVQSESVDLVFSSNFLEHLPDKGAVLTTLAECHRVLRPDGTMVVLMPNIRYLHGRYWDYFDHHTPLTEHSLVEALRLADFAAERVVPRFLPYTVKQRSVPKSTVLLRLYLRLPLLWPLFGRQMLVIARRFA